jgi:hypothetical protein
LGATPRRSQRRRRSVVMFQGSFSPRPLSSRSPKALLGTPAASLGSFVRPGSDSDLRPASQASPLHSTSAKIHTPGFCLQRVRQSPVAYENLHRRLLSPSSITVGCGVRIAREGYLGKTELQLRTKKPFKKVQAAIASSSSCNSILIQPYPTLQLYASFRT